MLQLWKSIILITLHNLDFNKKCHDSHIILKDIAGARLVIVASLKKASNSGYLSADYNRFDGRKKP